MEDKMVICASNAYNEKVYVNPFFYNLPKQVLEEIKAMTVLLSAKINGIATVGYNSSGDVYFEIRGDELNGMYDEIGAKYELFELQREKEAFLRSLIVYYKYFISEEGQKALENVNLEELLEEMEKEDEDEEDID